MPEAIAELFVTAAKQLPFATLLGLYIWFARRQEDTREDKRTVNAAAAATDWRKFFVKLETSSEKSQELQATTHAGALEKLGEHFGESLDRFGDKISILDQSHRDLTESHRDLTAELRSDRSDRSDRDGKRAG